MRSSATAPAALWVAFALFVQLMVPSAVMAAARPDAGQAVLCTGQGIAVAAQPGQAHAPKKGLVGMPCQDCLAAAMAAITPPVLAVRPALYAAVRVEHASDPHTPAPRARAPPRPLGQGPPLA